MVQEGRVDTHLRRSAEHVEGHTAGQLRGVAGHQHMAVRVRADRGQRRRTEVIVDLEVAEPEIITDALALLRVLLAVADRDRRLRRRVRVPENVVDVDAREAVGPQVLIHDPRCDRQLLGRLPQHRQTEARAVAVIDSLVHIAAGLDRFDETRQMVLEGREAHRGVGAERRIEHCAERAAGLASGCPLRGGVGERLEGAQLRLLRDIAHGARL